MLELSFIGSLAVSSDRGAAVVVVDLTDKLSMLGLQRVLKNEIRNRPAERIAIQASTPKVDTGEKFTAR